MTSVWWLLLLFTLPTRLIYRVYVASKVVWFGWSAGRHLRYETQSRALMRRGYNPVTSADPIGSLAMVAVSFFSKRAWES